MKIDTGILINAPAYMVREKILDFGNYSSWNPFFTSIKVIEDTQNSKTKVGPGTRLDVSMKDAQSGNTSSFQPVVLANDVEKLEWQGTLVGSWFFAGTHRFECKTSEDGRTCEFRQSEQFSGVALPLLRPFLSGTSKGFERMNEALKKECESRP
ncbi:LAME_0G08196g1_1 [Lachancea meyersii CBS 8951]|uniref:LAME_0G08196g1_1 n=1 Tax=Lachancea meyersii CBS 8951 TaxID=1266667 RepID=A0A1G4K855_9SACH|nr:LAME_0G08196g1_1 [Lachancea meyersii CBS 8951]